MRKLSVTVQYTVYKKSEGNGRYYLAAWVYLITHFLRLILTRNS